MSWHQNRMLLLDFESSGIDSHRDRIVTAAAIEVGGGAKTLAHEWLIDPGIDIPAEATAVHGITTEHARTHGRPAVTAVKEIGEHVVSCATSGVPIVGHNIGGYDLTLLWAELVRNGHQALADQVAVIRPVVDTMVIERHLDPYRPGKPNGRRPDSACGPHTLIECCRLWGIQLSEEDAHGAAADALAAGRLAWRLASTPPSGPWTACTTGRPKPSGHRRIRSPRTWSSRASPTTCPATGPSKPRPPAGPPTSCPNPERRPRHDRSRALPPSRATA